MLFEIQQELFFHLTTERLPGRPDVSCFEAWNPARDARSSNFEQVDAMHANLRHDLTSLFSNTKNPPDEFPALAAHYTSGHAHVEADHLFYLFGVEH
jgi:hypothetical protein